MPIHKIISGDTVTIINGPDVSMFQCGKGNNEQLLNFINSCSDNELELVTKNKAYENYVKRYGCLPPDESKLFDYGLPAYYICTDGHFKFPFAEEDGSSLTNMQSVWLVNQVDDLAVSVAEATQESAEDIYRGAMSEEPEKCITFCKTTKLIHSIYDFQKETTRRVYAKDLIDVQY